MGSNSRQTVGGPSRVSAALHSLRASALTACCILLVARPGGAAAPRVETGTVPVDGGSIYYEAAGSGSAALVFIHGGFGDRRMWDDQVEYFSREYRVVRYDHRGFGKSSAPDTAYSPVDDLRRLLDHLKIEKAHVIGNSVGGTLAIDFALQEPGRVASLVIVASGPDGVKMAPKDREAMMAVFAAAEQEGAEKAVEMWLANPMVAVTSRDPRTRVRLRTMVEENRNLFFIKYWPSEPLDPPALRRLGEIKAPTLVIVGDKDIPFVIEAADSAAKGIPGAQKVVISGADHLPQMLEPEQFNRALEEFLHRR